MIIQKQIKVPSAFNFLKLLFMDILLLFIPLLISIYFNKGYILLIFSTFYMFFFTFGYDKRPTYKNDLLYKTVAPVIGIFIVLSGFSLDLKSLHKAITFLMIEKKDLYLIGVFLQALTTYGILKFIFPGVKDEHKDNRVTK